MPNEIEKLPELLTMKQVSKILEVSIMTLGRWNTKGMLKAFRPTPQNVRRWENKISLNLLTKNN